MPGDVLYTIEKPQHGPGFTVVWASLTRDQRFGQEYPSATSGDRSTCWYSDKSMTIAGTFGGAIWTFQGSNDAPTTTTANIVWSTLNDQSDNALSGTAQIAEQVVQNTYYVRPVLASSSMTASVQVRLLVTTARGQHHD